MTPKIQGTRFGSISIADQEYKKDVVIRLNGKIEMRKKKLSKAVYGTSHIISFDEAQDLYQDGAETLVIGTGQFGRVKLSDEAKEFFKQVNCQAVLEPTPKAIKTWNQVEGAIIAVFHLTC
jgi:hypothetical protein